MKNSNVENRRNFLKAGLMGLSLPVIAAAAGTIIPSTSRAEENNDPGSPNDEPFWNDAGFFVQRSIDTSDFASTQTVEAFIDGKWNRYNIRHLSDEFIEWNLSNRISRLEDPMGSMTKLSGPHNGAVATYGLSRGDSRFSLNNAFKGFGPLPKESVIESWTQRLADEWEYDMNTKINTLKELYSDSANFDFRFMASIELYSTKEFQTHSFLNQMSNPISTVVFLDSPEGSFEFRAITNLLDPLNTTLEGNDLNRLKWLNSIHDYFHGGPNPTTHDPYRIAALYYIVEEFDNSPSSGKKGLRTVPPL